MISIYIYFGNEYLGKILDYIDSIDVIFSEIFQVRYDGLAWNNVEDFIASQYEGKIEPVNMMNGYGPHNSVYFSKKNFCIGISLSYSALNWSYDVGPTIEQQKEFEYQWAQLREKIFEKFPIEAICLTEGDYTTGLLDDVYHPDFLPTIHELCYKKDGKIYREKGGFPVF